MPGMFKGFIDMLPGEESNLYDPFIKIISQHVRNLKVVKTSQANDETPNSHFPFTLEPDCSVYQEDCDEENLDMSRVEFVIEFKSGPKEDPFVDEPKLESTEELNLNSTEELNPFVCAEGPTHTVLGQLTAYATAVLSAQYRTHTFTVFIVGEYARLIRWDRGGAVVTKKIHFDKGPYLIHFFVHYNMAQPEARGHDSTVGSAKPHEIGLAKAAVPELAKANSFLAVTASDGRFIIRGPDAQPDVPVGRWTRTSFAYDVNNKRRVILKDSWRIRADDIETEGKIYEILHANHVPNIPHFSCAGDVGDDTHHQSRTDEVFEKGCIARHSCWEPITRHRHYRIVLLTVGRKLEEFKGTKEFVKAMLAALKAAWDIRILHRDISPGNILIVSSDELGPNDSGIKDGLLIDWDLSKIVTDEKSHTAHQYSRTGTWQFMAADLVESSEIPQTLEHDLESFFWVILWVVMTRVPTNWTDEARSILINETMSPKVYSHTGGTVKENWLVTTSLKKFKTPTSPSLGEFVKVLLKSVSARYREPPSPTTGASDPFLLLGQPKPNPSTEQVQEVQVGLKFLKSHWTLLEQFESALNHEWPPNDEARLMGIMQPDSVVNYSTKRARSAVGAKGGFDMEESASKRRAGEC